MGTCLACCRFMQNVSGLRAMFPRPWASYQMRSCRRWDRPCFAGGCGPQSVEHGRGIAAGGASTKRRSHGIVQDSNTSANVGASVRVGTLLVASWSPFCGLDKIQVSRGRLPQRGVASASSDRVESPGFNRGVGSAGMEQAQPQEPTAAARKFVFMRALAAGGCARPRASGGPAGVGQQRLPFVQHSSDSWARDCRDRAIAESASGNLRATLAQRSSRVRRAAAAGPRRLEGQNLEPKALASCVFVVVLAPEHRPRGARERRSGGS